MADEKACRDCGFIISHGDTCPICGSKNLTNKWNSYIIVINPEKSQLAQKLNIKVASTFAIDTK
jgi:DNA-directed RNA polymerase subunit E"